MGFPTSPFKLIAQISLQSQLQQGLASLGQHSPWSRVINPEQPVTLYRVKQIHPIVYRSPLLKQVAAQISQTVDDLSPQLTEQLPTLPNWTLHINAQQNLECCWHKAAIAPYYQTLWDFFATYSEQPSGQDRRLLQLSNEELRVQYTHGRCVSLLALAQREGLILPEQPQWSRLNSAADLTFISAWVNCGDRLLTTNSGREMGAIAQFADHWHRWYGCSQLFGTVRRDNLTLAQARLSLIYLSQRFLSAALQYYAQLEPWRST